MFLIMGKRIARKRLGNVAEVCPICRDITCCTLTAVKSYSHFYFLPVSRYELLHYETRCNACGLLNHRDRRIAYTPVDIATTSINALAEATNPAALAHADALVDLHDRITRGQLSPSDRVALIADTFNGITYLVSLGNRTSADQGLQKLLAFFGILCMVMCPLLYFEQEMLYASLAVTGMLIAFSAVIYLNLKGPRLFLRKKAYPLLAIALAPISPTLNELTQSVMALRAEKNPIAQWLVPAKIDAYLRANPSRPLGPLA